MEIKYTTGWKKVAVLWSLNNKESIVQEIFVINWQEIPSWENFIATSLHDAPAVSWQENESKKIEKRYRDMEKEYNEKISKLRNQKSIVEDKLSYLWKFLKNCDDSSFESIVNFLTGNIKYVVKNTYNEISLNEYNEFIESNDNSLKLLSISWRDDWTLKFRLHRYSDYSGSSDDVFFFSSKEKAEEKIYEIVINSPIKEMIIDVAKKYDIKLDENKLKEFYEQKKSAIQNSIDSANNDISNWNKQLSEITLLKND